MVLCYHVYLFILTVLLAGWVHRLFLWPRLICSSGSFLQQVRHNYEYDIISFKYDISSSSISFYTSTNNWTDETGRLFYFMMMYVLYQTCYSCYHMPYTALTVYISSEPAQRDQATGFRMMFEVISLLVASILQGAFLSGAKVFSPLVILILICYLSVALLGIFYLEFSCSPSLFATGFTDSRYCVRHKLFIVCSHRWAGLRGSRTIPRGLYPSGFKYLLLNGVQRANLLLDCERN